MEGNFDGEKIWRICCKAHIGGIKFGESCHQTILFYFILFFFIQQNFNVIFESS